MEKTYFYFAIGLLVAAMALPAKASPLAMRVVGVMDGDTVEVSDRQRSSFRCRLYGIDAPESGQPFGQAAKSALSDAVYGKDVSITITGEDRYERKICKIGYAGYDINVGMVRTGYAWVYRAYTKDPAYYRAEEEAKAERAGLWRDPNPTAPWEWRRKK